MGRTVEGCGGSPTACCVDVLEGRATSWTCNPSVSSSSVYYILFWVSTELTLSCYPPFLSYAPPAPPP